MNLLKRPFIFLGLVLFLVSIFMRYQFLYLQNGDLLMNVDWYRFLQQNGYKGLASSDFSNYSPPYLYLLWLGGGVFPKINPILIIKLIPTLFDVISVVTVYKISELKIEKEKSFFFASLFFTLPTIMFNSSGWGQVDSIYSAFLLLCLYYILVDKPVSAMIVYGISFSFKFQAIFFLPFLGILFLRKKIYWQTFLVIPITYLVFMLPAIIIGRNFQSILKVYIDQAKLYTELARYAPNLYFLIPNEYFHPVFEIGMGVFIISMMSWAWINWKSPTPITQKQLTLTALASVALVPFLLPKMHDRYFYPADIFSFITAIFIPELWFYAFLFQVSSGLVYMIFPFGMPPLLALPAALINTVLVFVIARRQIQSLKEQ